MIDLLLYRIVLSNLDVYLVAFGDVTQKLSKQYYVISAGLRLFNCI